jgi:hypothetical protein
MKDAVRSDGQVIGSKISAVELEQIKKLVASGVYLNKSDWGEGCCQGQTGGYQDHKISQRGLRDRQKKKLWDTSRREAKRASEIEEDLELDYELMCQIMDELKREGRLAVL